jgi:hypothetical protein
LVPQQPISERSVKVGVPGAVAENVTITVALGSGRSRDAFASGGMKGFVVDLRIDAKGYATFRLEPGTDAPKSAVALETGGQRVVPVALTNYLPEKPEVPKVIRVAELTPTPTTGRGYFSWVAFTGQGIVSLLFEESTIPSGTTLLLEFELGDGSHRLRVSL